MALSQVLRDLTAVLTAYQARAPLVDAETSTALSQTSRDLVSTLRAHQPWALPVNADHPSPLPLLGPPHSVAPLDLPMSPARHSTIQNPSPSRRHSLPHSTVADRIDPTPPYPVGDAKASCHDHKLSFHVDEDPRLTASPAFRRYQWRSEAFTKNTWRLAEVEKATTKFFETLVRLDTEGFPKDSLDWDHATFRAHLGLPNFYDIKIDDKKGYTTKAAGAFWTSLLRFQVLDLLLSLAYGVSSSRSPKEPPPNGTGPSNLLSALFKWPTYLETLRAEYPKEKDDYVELPRAKTSEGGPEALAPMITLTDMNSATLATKTSKNFQAMGSALMWILECDTTDPFEIPVTMNIGDTFDGLHTEGKEHLKKPTLNTILRPLSYAINSSPVAAMCNIDLSKAYGHVMAQYKTRGFVGRYRPPRLMHLENVVMTVVREVAIGKPVPEAMEQHWYPGISRLPPSHPHDCDIFKIGWSLPLLEKRDRGKVTAGVGAGGGWGAPTSKKREIDVDTGGEGDQVEPAQKKQKRSPVNNIRKRLFRRLELVLLGDEENTNVRRFNSTQGGEHERTQGAEERGVQGVQLCIELGGAGVDGGVVGCGHYMPKVPRADATGDGAALDCAGDGSAGEPGVPQVGRGRSPARRKWGEEHEGAEGEKRVERERSAGARAAGWSSAVRGRVLRMARPPALLYVVIRQARPIALRKVEHALHRGGRTPRGTAKNMVACSAESQSLMRAEVHKQERSDGLCSVYQKCRQIVR
ncbi:hypothetical protein C8F04DRAFT_1184297 [Mycena alexandri]|uniref:Uncharacterized protein n=1 Tax=Mycena alexandri TaxID=1745969 RepID=A0AAD6SSW3_9AGAR|nr:hypothetical protein C8F04DRAFT_1184297 [Mycena alexandri]